MRVGVPVAVRDGVGVNVPVSGAGVVGGGIGVRVVGTTGIAEDGEGVVVVG